MLYWLLVIMLAVLLISDVYAAIEEFFNKRDIIRLVIRFLLLSALLYIIAAFVSKLLEITIG